MATDDKQLLTEYNKLRDAKCQLEGKSETGDLPSQRKHFPQSNRSSEENEKEEKEESESGKTSCPTLAPLHHKERRHFPEKNNSIFG